MTSFMNICIDVVAYNDVVIRCLAQPREQKTFLSNPIIAAFVDIADGDTMHRRYVGLFHQYEKDDDAQAFREERIRRRLRRPTE